MNTIVQLCQNKAVLSDPSFIEDIEQTAGVSIYHLVKRIYQRLIRDSLEIRAHTVDADVAMSDPSWRHTLIGLYGPDTHTLPKHLVVVAENPVLESVIVGFPGAEDLLRADEYHYYDLHDAVNSIGFFLIHGRKRSTSEQIAQDLLTDLPKDLG